jgi:serine phosphatase RsbU (regulator of sigma subunit)
VTDSRSASGDLFGEDRFAALAAAGWDGSAGALLASIEAALESHSAGTAPFDDVTLLAVKRE